jgi:hypothetical protein
MGEVVMQIRCIYCKSEQYGVAVFAISHSEHACVWCGKTPPIFTSEAEYWEAADPERLGVTETCAVCGDNHITGGCSW